jgi:hypothetical protein
MIFTESQIQEILSVIEYHHTFTAATSLGVDVLTEDDIALLKAHGIDISLLKQEMSVFDQMYYFGRLSGILRDDMTAFLGFGDFMKFIKEGQYIPLSIREKFELEIAKKQTYTHLKGLKAKVRGDVEASVLRAEYEAAIKEGLISGVEKRKSVGSIVSDIGHKIDDWKHDWGRIVETEMNNIFLMGKAAEFSEKYGPDVLVYKEVYEKACRHCIEKYLTNGLGSKPRLFKLSDLIKNGTNIGKKVIKWLATLTSLHPYCRCYLKVVPPRYAWNEETGRFELPKTIEHRVERKSKVKVTVGDKHFEV